jgi:adenylate kinase
VAGTDTIRGSTEIDVDCLRNLDLGEYGETTLFEGHLSHFLPVEAVIVLRTSPAVLQERLASRGWPPEKVRENMEAEACDVILIEATELERTVYEVDTTAKSPAFVARDIQRIMSGDTADYLPGKTDWSEEVLSWY